MKNFAMVFTLFFCSLMLFLSVSLNISDDSTSSGSSIFDPADLQQLKDTNECVDCNLKGADLEYADLGETDLRGADLRGASLKGAYLKSANLKSTHLRGANLKDADLRGAYLGVANVFYALMNGTSLCNTIMPDNSVIYSGC